MVSTRSRSISIASAGFIDVSTSAAIGSPYMMPTFWPHSLGRLAERGQA